MINLEIKGFTGKYANLNSIDKCRLSLWDLVRHSILVGNQSYKATLNSGYYKMIKRAAIILNAVRTNRAGYLILTDNYKGMDPSEKRNDSYYIGQSLCRAFAEKEMGIPWLVDYSKCSYKEGIAYTTKEGKTLFSQNYRPDFFALDKEDNFHIFEAKGGSKGYQYKAIKHSFEQVSIVKTIDGKIPETRVACYFNLDSDFRGVVRDPVEGDNGIDIKDINANTLLQDYYAIFKDKCFQEASEKEFFGVKYKLIPLFDGFYYGIQSDIKRLIDNDNFNSAKYKEFLASLEHIEVEIENCSIGKDGTLLCKL